MSAFLLSALFPLPAGQTFVAVYRVSVDQPIEWVKRHADEIAARAVADDQTARNVNAGQYTALWVEAAPC